MPPWKGEEPAAKSHVVTVAAGRRGVGGRPVAAIKALVAADAAALVATAELTTAAAEIHGSVGEMPAATAGAAEGSW